MVDRAKNSRLMMQKRKARGGAVEPAAATEEREPPSAALPSHLLSPEELYRRERARREAGRTGADALAEAREAYLALLREEAASGKGGRPRKAPANAQAAAPADDHEDAEPMAISGDTAEMEIVADIEAEALPIPDEEEEAPRPARKRKPAKAAARKAAPARKRAKRR